MKDKILECFLCENRLRFSEIERRVGVRSNKLSYHLGKMVSEGVLKKEADFYFLSLVAEKMIPYVSSKRAVMSVVLVAIEDEEGRVFLVERKKKPFLGKLALPGGRMVQGEGIDEAVVRIGKKFGVRCDFEKVCSVTLEHVVKKSERVHSFLLILVRASSEDVSEYVDFRKKKGKIVGSDYCLIERYLEKEIEVDVLETLD